MDCLCKVINKQEVGVGDQPRITVEMLEGSCSPLPTTGLFLKATSENEDMGARKLISLLGRYLCNLV